MQPTYLPWLGYFDLMDRVDVFVLLDSVPFSHQSWQHRNRIRAGRELARLTIPVLTKARHGQAIVDVEINRTAPFAHKHLRTLRQHYGRAPYLSTYLPMLETIIETGVAAGRLVDVTIPLLRYLSESLGISTTIMRSSELAVSGERSRLLVAICERQVSSSYLSPPGSVEYLFDDLGLFQDAGIGIFFQRFQHPSYRQVGGEPFVAYASLVDLLFNEGPESLAILRSGRLPVAPLAEVAACRDAEVRAAGA
jgi:hypothetical protein